MNDAKLYADLEEILQDYEKFDCQYLAIEDEKEKVWHFYNNETKEFYCFPFGYQVVELLNTYKRLEDSNKYHEEYRKILLDVPGLDNADIETMEENVLKSIEKIDYLRLFITQMDSLKKQYDKETWNIYLRNVWLKYRYCNDLKIWNDLFLESSNHDKEMQERLKKSLHRAVNERRCIYHDKTMLNSGTMGNVYCLQRGEGEMGLFHLDLFHVLFGNTQKIKSCSRCGQLYMSNNNQAKYCHICKKTPNTIRNENRKSNTCRYLHKKIVDKLNNYRDGSEEFLLESNYYWAIVQKKEPKQVPASFNPKIKTEKQYLKWLENYLEKA